MSIYYDSSISFSFVSLEVFLCLYNKPHHSRRFSFIIFKSRQSWILFLKRWLKMRKRTTVIWTTRRTRMLRVRHWFLCSRQTVLHLHLFHCNFLMGKGEWVKIEELIRNRSLVLTLFFHQEPETVMKILCKEDTPDLFVWWKETHNTWS